PVHCAGQKLGSVIAAGVLKDSETIHSTGIATITTATVFAAPQPTFCRPVVTAAISASSLQVVRAGGCGAEALDEQEGDDRHADEDQDGDGRPDAQVQRVEQVVVPKDRDRIRAIAAAGQDVDVVKDPERVQG